MDVHHTVEPHHDRGKKLLRLSAALAVIVLLLGGLQDSAHTGPGNPKDAGDGWTRVSPGGETTCARGTPYSFWTRVASPERVLIYLQEGGGCWDAETCRPGSTFFDDDVSEYDSPASASGIFDLRRQENPFKTYSMVFISYCTGDVHWGNRLQSYRGPDHPVVIHHKGFVNASAALEWTFRRFPAPKSVFVTGFSAGSVGSIAFAPIVIRRYPQAQVTQLGDSLAFVFHRPVNLQSDYGAHDNFPQWISEVREMRPGQFEMHRYYIAVARFYPRYRFGQFNTLRDAVQLRFFKALGGSEDRWEPALRHSLDAIHREVENFHSYLAGGHAHGVLIHPRFYTYREQGVRVRDWVADLAAGIPVKRIACGRCQVPGEIR